MSSFVRKLLGQQDWRRADVFESPDAHRVTSCPCRTSSSTSRCTTASVPPYAGGGTVSHRGAICRIFILTSLPPCIHYVRTCACGHSCARRARRPAPGVGRTSLFYYISSTLSALLRRCCIWVTAAPPSRDGRPTARQAIMIKDRKCLRENSASPLTRKGSRPSPQAWSAR